MQFLEILNTFLWGHLNFFLLALLGVFLLITSRFFQFRALSSCLPEFFRYYRQKAPSEGIHPLKAFYASLGGCLGVSNIVGICTAVKIGGPGALFWAWIAAFLGMLLKYSEVYISMTTRVKLSSGKFYGGPMVYLQKAFKKRWVSYLFCALFCLYAVEVYMFNVMVENFSINWHLSPYITIPTLLVLILLGVSKGIQTVGNICSKLLPLFLLIFVSLSAWALFDNIEQIPVVVSLVIKSAFTPHAAVGGFAGSSVMLALSMGASRACYSSDIGIGYAGIIHAESGNPSPSAQARLSLMSIVFDTLIVCTLSIVLVLVTDVWKMPIEAGIMVQTALSRTFPFVHLFLPVLFFLLGYTTIISFFAVGTKCALYLFPKKGKKIFTVYAILAFILFSFTDPEGAFTFMSLAGGLLLVINTSALFVLRKQVQFKLPQKEAQQPVQKPQTPLEA